MRIAYVCADRGVAAFDWKKGCSIHVQEIVRAFIALGHTVDVYATNTAGDLPKDLKGVTVHQLSSSAKGLDRAGREQAQINDNQCLRAALENGGPYDLIYERYSLWSFAAMEYAAAHEIPGILEVNSPLIDEQHEFRGLVDIGGAKRVADQCFSAASAICAVSHKVRDYLLREFDVGQKVTVIPNGVDPARFTNILRRRRLQSTLFTVGFVGSLKPWHGIRGLVDAFAELHRHAPDSQLLIVGDGPEREMVETQVRKLCLANAVTLTGAVRPAEIPALLAAMDVGVAPYPRLVNHYFSPLKVFEYMAAGLPVVVTSAGQLNEIITDECNGLLCEAGDKTALVDALLCLKRDPALRARLGRAARRKVLTGHTWRGVASGVLRFSDQHPPAAAGVMTHVAP